MRAPGWCTHHRRFESSVRVSGGIDTLLAFRSGVGHGLCAAAEDELEARARKASDRLRRAALKLPEVES